MIILVDQQGREPRDPVRYAKFDAIPPNLRDFYTREGEQRQPGQSDYFAWREVEDRQDGTLFGGGA